MSYIVIQNYFVVAAALIYMRRTSRRTVKHNCLCLLPILPMPLWKWEMFLFHHSFATFLEFLRIVTQAT